jgi:hypothetical protein
MTRTTHRYLTGVVTGLLVFSLAACASNEEKKDKKDPGPAALGYSILNNKGEPLYCKQIRPTGSNVARRTRCLTAAEWQNAQESDQRTLQELRRTFDYPSEKR